MTRTMIDKTAFLDAVAAAIQAPSLHNSQPWRFRLRESEVDVLADRERVLPASDPSGWAMRIACGAATFNMRLALAVQGHPVDVRWRPSTTDPDVMASLYAVTQRPPTPPEQSLYAAIPRRHSNRQPFSSEAVSTEARVKLVEAIRGEAAWLELVTGTAAVAAVAEITNAANRVLSRDAAYLAELSDWTRKDDAAGDGVPAVAGGPSPEPQDLFPQRPFGDRARAPGRDFEYEPLVAILGTPGDTPTDQLVAGYALQRILLTITVLGLAASMISQAIEVPAAREQLRVALGRFGSPQMVLRIGYGAPGIATPRRGPTEVIVP